MAIERTLIIFKPDAMHRGLVGEILARFERKGLTIVGMKLIHIDEQLAEQHYGEHKERPFYPALVQFITAAPVVVMVLQGPRAISIARTLLGKTFGFEAAPGTIRGDFGSSKSFNLVHGSDSPESAAREIGLYFQDSELHDWTPAPTAWVVHDEDRE